jgi:hypothetical protein
MRTLAADGLDLLAEDARDAASWDARIVRDRERAHVLLPVGLRRATELLLARAVAAGADAVALTGSTVRARRTAMSDLDLHVVGPRPSLIDVEIDADVYATTADVMLERLRAGDDYVQWTLRFGCVLFDTGALRDAAAELVGSGQWPSPERKLAQARRMLDLAEHVVASGDRDAAVEQVRAVLTGLGRWLLLVNGAFPLARAELPGQLRAIGAREVAVSLERCILREPSMDELIADLRLTRATLTGATTSRAA